MARSSRSTSTSIARPSRSSEHPVAYDEALANRVRAALGDTRPVQEKRMFGGLVFMVRGKMCVRVGKERIMCRIDPATHDAALDCNGCRTVIMGGRWYSGYLYIDAAAVGGKRQLDHSARLGSRYNGRE